MNYTEKEKYTSTYFEYLDNRAGALELYKFMENNGFFEAPASTKYHLSRPGGLVEHTNHVVQNAKALTEIRPFLCCNRSAAIVAALLHDICKIGKYHMGNDGKYYYNDDRLLGHGEESVIMAQKFIELTDEEIAAIRWHMGAYADPDKTNTLGKAYDKYPVAMLVHFADMLAAHIDEV